MGSARCAIGILIIVSRKEQFQATGKVGFVSVETSTQEKPVECLYLTPWCFPEGLRKGLDLVMLLTFHSQARGASRCSFNSCERSYRFFWS